MTLDGEGILREVAGVVAQRRAEHASSNFWLPRGTEVHTVEVFRPHNWDIVKS